MCPSPATRTRRTACGFSTWSARRSSSDRGTMGSNTRRWVIVATLFVAIVCNYLDRQLLSVLKPEILQHFGIGNLEYAWIVNVFLVCYAVMYPVSGLLVDRFGPRRVMLGGIVTWSLACVGGGMCGPGQVALFTVFRGILGLAEPTVFAS